jgi:hypothetical protein
MTVVLSAAWHGCGMPPPSRIFRSPQELDQGCRRPPEDEVQDRQDSCGADDRDGRGPTMQPRRAALVRGELAQVTRCLTFI